MYIVKNKFFTGNFVPAAQSLQAVRKAWLFICKKKDLEFEMNKLRN